MASITCRGFWLVFELSRYTRGLPLTSRCRIGKSSRIRSTSSGRVMFATSFPAQEFLPKPFVALRFELVRELGAAGEHDPAVHHHVDPVGGDVAQDPLVVGDEKHSQVRPDQRLHPVR